MLHDSGDGLIKILLATFGAVSSRCFRNELAKDRLLGVGGRISPLVLIFPKVEMMQQDNDEGEVAVLMTIEGVNVLGHSFGEV